MKIITYHNSRVYHLHHGRQHTTLPDPVLVYPAAEAGAAGWQRYCSQIQVKLTALSEKDIICENKILDLNFNVTTQLVIQIKFSP